MANILQAWMVCWQVGKFQLMSLLWSVQQNSSSRKKAETEEANFSSAILLLSFWPPRQDKPNLTLTILPDKCFCTHRGLLPHLSMTILSKKSNMNSKRFVFVQLCLIKCIQNETKHFLLLKSPNLCLCHVSRIICQEKIISMGRNIGVWLTLIYEDMKSAPPGTQQNIGEKMWWHLLDLED